MTVEKMHVSYASIDADGQLTDATIHIGDKVFYGCAPKKPSAWHYLPVLPPEDQLDYYGSQYSKPCLLHDGQKVLEQVVRWSFVEDGWVQANFTEGTSPLDYEDLNRPVVMRWMLLSSAYQEQS